jgi:hypothetical protein
VVDDVIDALVDEATSVRQPSQLPDGLTTASTLQDAVD